MTYLGINHEEAGLLARIKEPESNLARAYLDLVDILVCVTHHEGAVDEYKSRWLPIVQNELTRRHHNTIKIFKEN